MIGTRGQFLGGGIAAVLSALERRISALEHRQQQDESLQPNYLTLNAQGQVGALFTGGLQLNEASGLSFPPPSANSIQWFSGTGSVETIGGTSLGGGNHDLVLRTNADANDISQLELRATAGGGSNTAVAKLTLNNNGGGSATFIIGGSGGFSDFVQSNNKQPTATAGAATLPANPVGFLQFQDTTGNSFKVPYYNL